MEDNTSEKWKTLTAKLGEMFDMEINVEAILFLIGLRELGSNGQREFSKEEKQDLMHIGLCTIFKDVFYKFEYKDEEGWLHFEPITDFERIEIREQENLIKEKVIAYFKSNNLIE